MLSKGGMRGFSSGLFLVAALIACFTASESAAELAAIDGRDGVIRIVRRSELASRTTLEASAANQQSVYEEFDGRRPTFAELSSLIEGTAKRYGLDPAFVMALVKIESNFNPYAISHKGARGLMQLMPATARMYGLRDYHDPVANVDAGVRHLRMLFKRYESDVDRVLAAYNAGSSAVDRYGGIPPYPETIRFIRMVKKAHRTFSGGRTLISGIATFSWGGGLYRSVRQDGTIVIREFPSRQ